MCKLSGGTCVLIILLVVLLVSNILLLAHFIYQSMKHTNKHPDTVEIENLANEVVHNRLTNSKRLPIINYRFIAAVLVLHHGNRYESDMVICGASIISRHWALTAAHCSEILIEVTIDKLRVSSNSSRWLDGHWHRVRRIVVHENYDGLSLANDISLINVEEPFAGTFVAPIPLAGRRYRYLENSAVTVVGWSADKNTLFGMDLQLFADKHCRTKYPQLGKLGDSVFCAGRYRRPHACVFDFGGPAVQRNVLVGIVSYRGDCERDKPGIYTKVGVYEPWFRYIEKRYNIDIGAKYV